MFFNNNIKLKFKACEFQHFNWLYNLAPCFPVNASKINVITDPRKFYDTLCERFKNANSRISVASLYIGTGSLEKRLLEIARKNVMQKKDLKFSVLLDYQRGTRGTINSMTLLQDYFKDVPDQCTLSLYQTPRLQGSWSKALPSRYNELVGLQHMKLYIADDSVILSGANFSNDYFTQRQDRYIEIEDPDLANFYSELIDEVSKFSKRCTNNELIGNKIGNKDRYIEEVRDSIRHFIDRWKEKQTTKLLADKSENDTWVFPLLQMGEFRITQDEDATKGFLMSAPEGSQLSLATGYFNLTEQYVKTILQDCKSDVRLLMAHPNANGFMGAAGPAGGIPHAYSLIARMFWQRVEQSGQTERIKLFEYEREMWTFHAKGLWYYGPGGVVPCVSLVGSANLGERSVRRDLEAQAALLTTEPLLQNRLHEECENLNAYSRECARDLEQRRTPLWVRATVGLFRTYF